MNQEYEDIKSKIKERPQWYDNNGTPRYCKFHPDMLPDIYASEAVLLKIECQYCRKKFLVAMGWSKHEEFFRQKGSSFSEMLKNKHIPGYGDPPIHGCIGDTETSDTLRIVEFWNKNFNTNYEWKRIKRNEIECEKP